jgi:hypothetical protein
MTPRTRTALTAAVIAALLLADFALGAITAALLLGRAGCGAC